MSLSAAIPFIGAAANTGRITRGVLKNADELVGATRSASKADSARAIPTQSSSVSAPATPAPRNSHLAGKTHPKTDVPFDMDGYPDFRAAGVVKTEVKITPTGSRARDFAAANKSAGFNRTPEGYTWHHHQDGTNMQLVPRDIHAQTGHTGGFSSPREY